VTVGLVWLYLAEYSKGEKATIRQDYDPYGYQLGAMLCFLIFLDSLLKQIEGPRDIVWFGFSSGKWGLILVLGVLSVLCQLLYWSDVVRVTDRSSCGGFKVVDIAGHQLQAMSTVRRTGEVDRINFKPNPDPTRGMPGSHDRLQ
jgi:hypothetical protein